MTYSNNLFSFFFIDNIIMNIDDIPIAPTGAVSSIKEIRDKEQKKIRETNVLSCIALYLIDQVKDEKNKDDWKTEVKNMSPVKIMERYKLIKLINETIEPDTAKEDLINLKKCIRLMETTGGNSAFRRHKVNKGTRRKTRVRKRKPIVTKRKTKKGKNSRKLRTSKKHV